MVVGWEKKREEIRRVKNSQPRIKDTRSRCDENTAAEEEEGVRRRGKENREQVVEDEAEKKERMEEEDEMAVEYG